DAARAAATLRFTRIVRPGGADRTQLGGHARSRWRRGRRRSGRLGRRRGRTLRGGLLGRGLARGGGAAFGFLLLREGFGGGLLLRLLVGDALLLQLGLAQRGGGGVGLLFLGTLGDRGLGIGDGGLEPRQRRRLVVGLLHQRIQALGLDDVLAADALLGGDEDVGHQVGERAGDRGIAGLLLAQRQVVLHGVVAFGRVQPLLAQRLAGGFAQLVDVHRPD